MRILAKRKEGDRELRELKKKSSRNMAHLLKTSSGGSEKTPSEESGGDRGMALDVNCASGAAFPGEIDAYGVVAAAMRYVGYAALAKPLATIFDAVQ